jgi:hypothetical protein
VFHTRLLGVGTGYPWQPYEFAILVSDKLGKKACREWDNRWGGPFGRVHPARNRGKGSNLSAQNW